MRALPPMYTLWWEHSLPCRLSDESTPSNVYSLVRALTPMWTLMRALPPMWTLVRALAPMWTLWWEHSLQCGLSDESTCSNVDSLMRALAPMWTLWWEHSLPCILSDESTPSNVDSDESTPSHVYSQMRALAPMWTLWWEHLFKAWFTRWDYLIRLLIKWYNNLMRLGGGEVKYVKK